MTSLRFDINSLLLSLPAGFIIVNFISAGYIITTGVYNGDFQGIPSTYSNLEVIFFAVIGSIPYYLIYSIIKNVRSEKEPKKVPNLFFLFVVAILLISLFLTLVYGVGIYAQEIYQVPTFLKIPVVLINRLDVILLVSILLITPRVLWKQILFLGSLLFLLTILRGSLQGLMLLFILFYFKIMDPYQRDDSGLNKMNGQSSNTLKYIIIFSIACLIAVLAPYLYELRESVRGITSVAGGEINFFSFFFGKLLGRLSNLSSLLIFFERIHLYVDSIDQLPYFAYQIDALKYFWGGFFPSSGLMDHYNFFTAMLDPFAKGHYAMQSGLIPALSISFLKSPFMLILDLFLIFSSIILFTKIAVNILGPTGKLLSITILIFPVLSGAANQFANPLYSLSIIYITFILIKKLNIRLKSIL